MKILVIHDIGEIVGGAEVVVYDSVMELRRRGHDVRILSGPPRPGRSFFSDYQFQFRHANLIQKAVSYTFNPFAWLELRRVLASFRPDLVHLHTIHKASPSVLLPIMDYPTLATIHDYSLFYTDLRRLLPDSLVCNFASGACCPHHAGLRYYWERFRSLTFRHLIRSVDLVMPNSAYMSGILMRAGFTNISDRHSLGVRLPNYQPMLSNDNLLFVGRLESEKGVEFLLRSLPAILQSRKETTLRIVGEGRQAAYLRDLATKLNIDSHVTVTGYVSRERLQSLYRDCSILVVPSIWPEPLGLVGIEAMSVGRPVVGTKVGGIPEWLHDGTTGYLVEPRSPDQISEAVVRLLSDRARLVQLGKDARHRAEDYSVENYVDDLEQIYADLVVQRLLATHESASSKYER